jgi:hypothetical protein
MPTDDIAAIITDIDAFLAKANQDTAQLTKAVSDAAADHTKVLEELLQSLHVKQAQELARRAKWEADHRSVEQTLKVAAETEAERRQKFDDDESDTKAMLQQKHRSLRIAPAVNDTRH